MLKDYYKILGVIQDAEDIVIKAAYRALAQRYHPDKWVGDPVEATRRMSEINMAYDVLSDQTKRKQYDQGRASNEYDESEDFSGGESEGDFGKSLDADWKEAVKYFPDLDGILGELSNISRPLAQTYKVYLLESKEFTKRKAIATQFELRFIKKYFGSNEEVVKFARFLIKLRARVAAKDLNRAVTLLGSDVDHKLIINRILKDYPDVASAYNPKPQKASQKTDFIDEFGKFLDPDARHGVWDYPKGHRPDSRTFSPIYLALGGLIVIVAVLIITLRLF